MNPHDEFVTMDTTRRFQTRRAFLGRSGAGLGLMALASLLRSSRLSASERLPSGRLDVPRWDGVEHATILEALRDLRKVDGEHGDVGDDTNTGF